jgi:hypothetical protein
LHVQAGTGTGTIGRVKRKSYYLIRQTHGYPEQRHEAADRIAQLFQVILCIYGAFAVQNQSRECVETRLNISL